MAAGSSIRFEYRVKNESVRVGDFSLNLQTLESLDETIDSLYEHLQKTETPDRVSSLMEELCPYFGVIWPSGYALTQELGAIGSPSLQGKSLLEVGCGLALPSLLAAQLGAKVTATDFHPEVSRFLEANLRLNALSDDQLGYLRMDWKSDRSPLGYDWVIGSDILYERQHPPMVARVLDAKTAQGGTALVADPGRPYLQEFVDEMSKFGFRNELTIRTVPPPHSGSKSESKDIFLIRFRR